jgi:lysophospholipase L1-like esterase
MSHQPSLGTSLRTSLRTRLACALAALAAALALPLVPVAPAHAAAPSYVALGDSYSSGVGTRSYISDGTSCQRSTYAYPALVAAQKGYALSFQACSGAKISNVTNSQLGALSGSTRYVTISVGGNDAGFSSVLTECAKPWWASHCGARIDTAQAYIKNTLPGALATLYRSIDAKAPDATVVVVGYPRLFNGEDCNAGTWFSPAEAQRDRGPARQQAGDRRGGPGLRLRQPDRPLRRARGLRRPRVAQRALQPDQRELPPQPHRAGLGLPAPGRRAAGLSLPGEGRGPAPDRPVGEDW